ncbi:hypothetical protein CEP51_013007 [Fusarium floridanum]|uniref:Uncharacterized protein n=1 Tax=Fusarium floridanum TaxID=1325733 RepID=A0A428QJ72_9HYPO|nr:hypothetical protein CEP51_013007 [Fusarium floridanum]
MVDADSPATLISRDIELTTTMDLLAACGEPSRLTSFFLESVDCPGVSSFDRVNWRFAKYRIVELGKTCSAIASSIAAITTLFKAQLVLRGAIRRPGSRIRPLPGGGLPSYPIRVHTPGRWRVNLQGRESAVPRTIAALGTASRVSLRTVDQTHNLAQDIANSYNAGRGMGLMSETICCLLPNYDGPFPSIKPPTNSDLGLSTHLHDVLCAPVFDFYFRLQILSGQIAKLTHYHRSRTTGVDQEEVSQRTAHIKSRLQDLWESRSAIQREAPEDLRDQLAPRLANAVTSLVGICNAAYHAELVEIDRVLGDPVTKWTDSRKAIHQIRQIVDDECTASDATKTEGLNPGYLRPLFLYAIECMDKEENQWAVDRIAQIRDPIYRSKFFSTFAKELSDAQMRKERRVTSKYFCIWYFGTPPPYL